MALPNIEEIGVLFGPQADSYASWGDLLMDVYVCFWKAVGTARTTPWTQSCHAEKKMRSSSSRISILSELSRIAE